MTQALMDLAPRIDATPSGRQADSRASTDSGAAFADAVDQAVSEANDRPGRSRRANSGRDEDAPGHDKPEKDTATGRDDAGPGDAANGLIWALSPHELHGVRATVAGSGKRPAGGHRIDASIDVAAPSARRPGASGGAATRGSVTAGLVPAHVAAKADAAKGGSAAKADGAAHADATKAGAAYRQAAGEADATGAGAPRRGSAAAGPENGTRPTSTPATATVPSAVGAAAQHAAPGARSTGAAATPPSETSVAAADPAKAARSNGARSGHSLTAHQTRPPIGTPTPADAPRDPAAPGAAGRAASYSAAPLPGTDWTSGSSASATSTAANQLSPTAVHVPTPVAATVNSTPVAAAAPSPTPFAQAQPDVAMILAQLRGRTDGTYQLRAQVHPAELGAVAITATVHHGALSVTLTPDQAAQQAISQSLPQLRQHLADQGFTGVNVGLGSPQQSGHQGQGGDRQTHAQGSDHSIRHGKDTAVGAVDHPSTVRTGGTLSALDLML